MFLAKTISQAVRKLGTVPQVSFVPVHHGLVEKLCDVCQEGDLLITQGAGDITLLGPQFIEAMQARLDGAAQQS